MTVFTEILIDWLNAGSANHYLVLKISAEFYRAGFVISSPNITSPNKPKFIFNDI